MNRPNSSQSNECVPISVKELVLTGLLLLSVVSFGVSSGCAGKKPQTANATDTNLRDTPTPTPSPTITPTPDPNALLDEEWETLPDGTRVRKRDRALLARLQNIPFEYDQSTLTSEGKKLLGEGAVFLSENPDIKVAIEGHCDERGTNPYNLSLGQRRAEVVRDYLILLGVSGSRLSTISYGEERPLSFGEDEASFARNRRVQFTVSSR